MYLASTTHRTNRMLGAVTSLAASTSKSSESETERRVPTGLTEGGVIVCASSSVIFRGREGGGGSGMV